MLPDHADDYNYSRKLIVILFFIDQRHRTVDEICAVQPPKHASDTFDELIFGKNQLIIFIQ